MMMCPNHNIHLSLQEKRGLSGEKYNAGIPPVLRVGDRLMFFSSVLRVGDCLVFF
ncbi:hypothetical protein COLO4_04591 [Corchorus olitorius]|uniref:Uncharacterized protein n=1 Tax=Corchorus olitorius TaxID=93759 RepID=A0A1R3KTD2_9ROSI|nr:hypothetical protein COLO4_04591 [Corchorus olitorius]